MRIPFISKFIEKRSTVSPALEAFIKGADLDANTVANSGKFVNEDTAMQVSAVYACVKVLAETVASLPLPLYKREQNGGKEKAYAHPLYRVLHDLPNSDMTSFTFREVMMTYLLLWGNAYAQIIRDGQKRIIGLEPLKPQNMSITRDEKTKKLKYQYTDGVKTIEFKQEQVFHIPALSFDGIKGISPIAQAREAIGLALATEEFGARFFGNGARPGGVLEHPGVVKDPQKLRESWEAVYKGAKNAHKIAVLEEGMKYREIGIPPEDAQFLETRKFQLNEICRIFRVPPHLVGDLERSTNNNIELQSIEFVVHTVRPWLVRWEQAIFKSLLSEADKEIYFAKFNVDGLMRGDFNSRMAGYAVGRQNGWLSANDIRGLEDMNPIPKEQGGDLYLVNGNMVAASQAAQNGGDANVKATKNSAGTQDS